MDAKKGAEGARNHPGRESPEAPPISTGTLAGALTGAPATAAKLKLKRHQEEIVRMMDDGPLGIFAEAGTGKTMIALTWISNALADGRIDDALVICPSSLVHNWRRNIAKMSSFDGFTDVDASIVGEAVTVTSYRKTWKEKKGRSVVLRDDVDKDWGAVIVDESHRLGTHNSMQTRACLTIAKRARYRYIMTGTPDSTNYTKLYGQIKFLDPPLWPRYRDFYKNAVIEEDYFHNPKKYDTEWCESLKRQYGTVVRLRDCFDMPGSAEEDVHVENRSKTVYKDILDGRYEKHGITPMGAGTGYGKLLQICSGHLKTDGGVTDLKTDKLDVLLEIVEGTDDKVVVFAKFRRSIERICGMLRDAKIPYHRFDGTVQEPVWQEFQRDGSKVIVTQYQRGGVGIDLCASSTCIFFEPTFSVVDLDQAKARIMRIGQVRTCLYYYLVTTGTVEERAWASVRGGVDVSTEMLDRWAEEERSKL